VKTLLARLALIATDDPLEKSPSDEAFSIYTGWLHHCLALVDQDRMQGYSSYLSTLTPEEQERFRGLSEEEQKDQVFDSLLTDKEALLAFSEPLYTGSPSASAILAELKKYIRATPSESPI
jgi:restriction endonuclease